jgi:hypothetical protein
MIGDGRTNEEGNIFLSKPENVSEHESVEERDRKYAERI